MSFKKEKFNSSGFTLIEAVVGCAVFAILAVGIYGSYLMAARLVDASRMLVSASSLANEQFEIAHNMPYANVGTVDGVPAGKIPPTQNIVRDGFNFQVVTTIRNIDDPFDGTLGGAPNDTSPADYKLMQIDISIPSIPRFSPQSFTEYIAPKNLENASTNGALFVKVFDANGLPVVKASVHVENDLSNPPVIINDTTNNDGILEVVDVPPGVDAYNISVSKTGYSEDQTYPMGSSTNPNPVMPPATVAVQQVTQVSFAIDKTSTLDVESVTENCQPVANISFSLAGSKLIGSSPYILKYQNNLSTGSGGQNIISGLEWDTYTLNFIDKTHDLGGTISPIPLSLSPGSTQDVKLISVSKDPDSLLISVLKGGTVSPLSGAKVSLSLFGSTSSEDLITGQGSLQQVDWSGQSGQNDFTDPASYFSSDGNIETNSPAGNLKLKKAFGLYAAAGNLISSSFDTGSASNFYQLKFLPADQAIETGTTSVRLQIAANNDDQTWNFLGPDGTAASYYVASNTNISAVNNNNRYLRYKIYLSTASSTFTPDVGEVNFTYSSLCVPSGQVLFHGLKDGEYTLTVSENGYQQSEENITVSSPWQLHQVTLLPQ